MAALFMFDAYGTLFDVHSAVLRAGEPLGQKAQAFSALWRVKQLEYSWTLTAMGKAKSHDFWALTQQALDFALEHFGVRDTGLRTALLGAYRKLDAFPEVPDVLGKLQEAGHRTAVFTNGTESMVADAIAAARLGRRIDQVITVEGTGFFKPSMTVYAHAAKAAGVQTPGEITFVSSNRWDVAGAAAAGFKPVWVNRGGQPDEYRDWPPMRIVRDLLDLVD